MMSLNMLIEFGDAFDFTGADFAGWCKDAGFADAEVVPLAGPTSAAIAYKEPASSFWLWVRTGPSGRERK